jgi:hypothetical protein
VTEYEEQVNRELRQSIAAQVLEAMDVDQYLIDAVRAATPDVQEPEPKIKLFDYSNTKVTRADLGLPEAEQSVPLEKVRQVLRSSPPAHHLLDTSTWTAYTDLRKRIAALLPEGAQ